MSNETNTETNNPIEARELTEKELEGVVGGKVTLPVKPVTQDVQMAVEMQVKLAGTFA